jgi:hypothetical protein
MAITCQVWGATSATWQLLGLFSFMGPLPVLWVGLRYGFTSALWASGIAVGFVATATLFGAPYHLTSFLPQVLMILVLVRFSLLSRTNETNVKEWYPAGQILAYLIGISAFSVFVQIVLDSGPLFPDETLRAIAKEFATTSSIEEQVYETLKRVMYFYPGVSALTTLLLIIGNAGFAQRLLERNQQNVRPQGAFSKISLPGYYLWGVAGAAGLTIFGIGGAISPNILMVLVTGFFLVGLSMVHELIKLYKFGTITLVVFYLVMITFGWLTVLVSLLGLMEPWLRSHPKLSKTL